MQLSHLGCQVAPMVRQTDIGEKCFCVVDSFGQLDSLAFKRRHSDRVMAGQVNEHLRLTLGDGAVRDLTVERQAKTVAPASEIWRRQ